MARKYHTNIPAAYLVLIKDNQILLLQRANTGYNDGLYSFIAGHVDPNESFSQCIIREAREEAGITILPEYLDVIHVQHRFSEDKQERVDVYFTPNQWTGEITNCEPHKCSDLSWYPLDNLPSNIIPYIREVINNIQNNDHYSEHGWD